ncbi:4795_t:CDS:2, partial [Gigaspora margarita]
EQAIIRLDNLAQTIPPMLSKIDFHKPAKQQQLPLLGDENIEQSKDSFAESAQQIFNTNMMLPTISCLFAHLDQMKSLLVLSNILDVCYQIKDSMLTYWKNNLIECYVSSYLDSRFKNMNFISKKKKEIVQNKLSKMIEMATNTIDALVQTEIDHFYNRNI